MPRMAAAVRQARKTDDAVAPLLYASAAAYYDAYAGSAARALAIVRALYPRGGHAASWDACQVAVLDDVVVGVLAGFPAAESEARARRFVALSAPRVRPADWLKLLAHLRAAGRASPITPAGAWYVDALAVAEPVRRRGIARLLLAAAETSARCAGAAVLAVDTGLENAAAQALYESSGFRRRTETRADSERTARALGGKGFVAYAKRLD